MPNEEGQPEVADSDPTEVIDIGAAMSATEDGVESTAGVADSAPEERRYTAPGFDAGSTQIIDRVPDPPTELIATHTDALDISKPRTGPQIIAPTAGRKPRWLRPKMLAVLVALLIAGLLLGLFLLLRGNALASRESMVRTTIETFDQAVRDGDLATLRTVTCGQTLRSYDDYDEAAWDDTYAKVAAAKQYPVVASIDAVVVHGDSAEANVTSYMAYDPATTSTRSFDLQFRDDQWKICQAS